MPKANYGSLEDRAAIRELSHAYADAVFQCDVEAWGACWTEDAVWNLGGKVVEGLPEMKTFWSQVMTGYPLAAYFASVDVIEITGDTAYARAHTQEVLTTPNGDTMRTVGEYNDDLQKVDGEWKFKKRVFKSLHRATFPAAS